MIFCDDDKGQLLARRKSIEDRGLDIEEVPPIADRALFHSQFDDFFTSSHLSAGTMTTPSTQLPTTCRVLNIDRVDELYMWFLSP